MPIHPEPAHPRRRWGALYVLCLGVLMIVLDTTIVNVALPSIRADLGFTQTSLVWVANVSGVLWAASMFAWFFMSALYLQRVLGYTPMQVGLSFLSLGASARVVVRWGIRGPLAAGLLLAAAGLALFARAPADGSFALDVFPGMVLLGGALGLALLGWVALRRGAFSQEEGQGCQTLLP